jgi:predicted TIM-barrel fold metal-dependent hydrolase
MKPQIKNLYGEVGSTFALTVVGAPELAAHTLGKLLTHLGPDYVIWGTDSLWWGSPQWQIEALRRFRIPDRLIEGYGYTQITNEMKAKILGLNAARVLGIDVEKARREIGSDKIAQAKAGKAPMFTV